MVYRTGRWFAQHFIQIPLILATPVHYKQKGVYVVIGGAGGLGQEWTRFMLECYQAHVIWIGRRQYDVSIKNKINALSALGSAPLYISADATKLDELQQAHKTILQKYSAIDGVVHSAGVLNDQTLALMDEAQFRAGFSAKVDTTVNMNRVFGGENLGLMLFFSSIVSFVKSPAQSNYAAGCTFKDSFAHRLKKTRPYAVKVMNWGYWGSVGGAADEYHNKTMERMSIGSIEADEGMTRLQSLVSSGLNQMAVIKMLGSQEIPYLTLSRLNSESAEVSDHKLLSPIPSPPEPSGVQPTDTDSLREKGIVYFQKLIASTLKMRPDQIEPRRSLADYGLDSILVGQLTFKLRKAFPGVNATLLFEVKNIEGLVDYFIKNKKQELAVLVLPAPVSPATQTEQASPVPAQPQGQYTAGTRGRRNAQKSTRNIAPYGGAPDRGQIQPDFQTRSVTPANRSIFDVAVIGLSGRYPGAKNLKELWTKLSNGVNCITEIPKERWKWEDYYDPEKGKSGKIYTRWGGFLEGIDQFDPLFFKISPKEARTIDPQERLFLESCYHAIEDAGYTPESLGTPEKVGVFVGVMNSRYGRQPAHFSVANRVSFIFNFQGPSMAVDTACSASLTAIHLALEGIYNGDCKCAIAGGVNLIIDPVHYFQLTEMRMLSSGGECRVFGDQADGVVDGEGVGAVILKPLQEAERDGDHIYGVIKASAINAGGKTNGYTVPNPQAQARVVVRALERARIPAEHLSYIEAHGTGTPLGDPIEIAGLTRAFNESSGDIQSSCPIGSLKSNIGHCESAAGIAGLTKVLLQLKHQQLAPSLHSEIPNPEIDFSQTPFKLQRTLEHWARPVRERSGVMQEIPRIAGISSFGAGGANAHLIVQEHMSSTELSKSPRRVEDTGVVILLSARSAEQLKQRASDLLDLIREEQPSPTSRDKKLDLVSMAYTLQVGREPMEERLGLIVNSAGQLVEKLEAYVEGERDIEGAYQGQVKRGHEALSFFSTDADLQRTVDKWIANRKVSKLLELWVKGLEVDWSKLYGESRPQRMSLPTYPFAKERYWMDTAGPRQIEVNKDVAPVIHPLLHRNTSDLSEQRFSSTFAGDEFFLADHQVKLEGNAGQKILPGVAYLELARAALEQAWPECRESAVLELRNVVFAHPVVVTGSRQINIALLTRQNDQVDFEVYSHDADQEIIHCQGLALCSQEAKPATIDIEYLKKAMQRDKLESGSVYAAWSRIGVIYGPAFQAITALYRGTDQALAQLRLPDAVAGQAGDYVLHPSLMDGALQAAIGLIDTQCEAPTSPRIPFALDSLRIIALCSREMFAWVRYAAGIRAEDSFAKLDIDLCDERGNVCVQMHGLSSRVLGKENIDSAPTKSVGRLLAIPVWQNSAAEIAANADRIAYTEHNIILCGLSEVAVEQLISLLPDSQCVSLPAAERKNFAERYSDYALACFKRIQAVLQGKPQGKVLLQIIVGGDREQAVLSGLWGLLRTATLENPQVIGQLLIVPTGVTTDELGRYLQTEMCRPSDEMVRYEQGVRQVVRWQEIPEDAGTPPVPFKDHGTYLITGGLGALGILFAKEILRQVPQAKVVLTGRSALNVEKQSLVDGLCTPAGRVSYRQVDVSNSDEVGNLVAAIKSENGQINGIMHSAGIISDNFILKKSTTEFKNVLAPKVKGTYNLDEATREIELDFFVLFSSISGAMGNVGQSDYAVANGFMDQFAAYRNALVTAKQRHGLTRSINLGAWQAGGMGTDANRKVLEETTGMRPMQTAAGIEAFYRSLILPHSQLLVAEGDLSRLRHALTARRTAVPELAKERVEVTESISSEILAEKMQDYLRREFSELLQVPAHKIDSQAPLENYGIDSILAMKLTNKLEQTFGSLSKTLFFEYQTIAGLAGYFLKAHPAIMREHIAVHHGAAASAKDEIPGAKAVAITKERKLSVPARRSNKRFATSRAADDQQEIAIIGMAGRYPQAENLEEFWKNLQNGRDSITEIPLERWDHSLYYDPDPN
ncbi:MAG: SDR family NAD(P)-dependent oxidoreductase, partial [Candidatus Angelobacter sp.]